MKRVLLSIFCWLIFICPALAENFYIDNYDINIIVDKNKSAKITENLDVYFTNPSHGIFRDIPYKNATITDIGVSEQANITYGSSNVNIKIGDPDTLISGKHHYAIKYRYNYHDNKNEFYHNIVGTGWDTDIRHVNFDVIMPENIQPSDVGLSIGEYGTRGFNGGAIYSVKDNHIYGQTSRTLSSHEGITLRAVVPEGYFNKYVNNMPKYVIAGMILITLLAFLIWFKFGKDEPVIPVVNFHVPDNLTPLELELAYKGNASTKGLVGMLIDLARQGYIKINSKYDDWSLQKIKTYDGNNIHYRNYMNALFRGQVSYITKNDLANSRTFYKDCENIVNSINTTRNKIFNQKSISISLQAMMFMCLAGLVISLIFTICNYNISTFAVNWLYFVFPMIAIVVFLQSLNSSTLNFFTVIWVLGFGGGPLAVFLSETSININETLPVLIVAIISLIITSVCFYQLPQRNKVGQKLLNEIAGLKRFIEVAEKDRLQSLVDEDPEYFYKILPAAYILGVSDKWINKFESMTFLDPTWYGGGTFNDRSFNDFTRGVHNVSVPSTQNGGISSSSGGGGFSGGGGGGGGGGSW